MLPRDVEAVVADFDDQAIGVDEDIVSFAMNVGLIRLQCRCEVACKHRGIGHTEVGCGVHVGICQRDGIVLVDGCGDSH